MRDIRIILFCVAVVVVGWWVLFRSGEPGGPAGEPGADGPVDEAGEEGAFTTAEGFQRSHEAARLLSQAEEADRAGSGSRAQELLGRAAAYRGTWAGGEAARRLAARAGQQTGEQPSGAADERGRPAVAVETALPPEEAPRRADEPYTVAPGDTFTHIARRMGTTVEQIKLANRKRDDLIRVGDRITVSWRVPSVVIDKAGPRLYLIYRGEVLRSYPCGIGKMDRGSGLSATPEGVFVIEKKVENPPWWRPGERIEYGDPRNILGTRWMGFKPTETLTGYGIHGTTQPETVPGRHSQGCIRLLNKDVEEVFEWVPKGTKVYIYARWRPPVRAGGPPR